jgi:hypothetical protein
MIILVKGVATFRRNKQKLLDDVRNSDQPCVVRGKAIDELLKSGMLGVEIASETGLSKASVSHLRTVSQKLTAPARQLCLSRKMNRDACYTLALVPGTNQESVFKRADELRKKREAHRLELGKAAKGRQTLRGQITDKDVKDAIRELEIR